MDDLAYIKDRTVMKEPHFELTLNTIRHNLSRPSCIKYERHSICGYTLSYYNNNPLKP